MYKKTCRKWATRVNSRTLFNFIKYPKTAIACKEFFYKSDILKQNYQRAFKKITLLFFRTACHPYVTRMSFVCHVIRMSLVCTRMSSYVTCMYSYVIRMSLVCTRMSSVCHCFVLVCHPYVTRMCFYHEPLLRITFKENSVVSIFVISVECYSFYYRQSLAKKRSTLTTI